MEEGVPMTMIAHQLNYNVPEDVAFGEARVRGQSMAAEDFPARHGCDLDLRH